MVIIPATLRVIIEAGNTETKDLFGYTVPENVPNNFGSTGALLLQFATQPYEGQRVFILSDVDKTASVIGEGTHIMTSPNASTIPDEGTYLGYVGSQVAAASGALTPPLRLIIQGTDLLSVKIVFDAAENQYATDIDVTVNGLTTSYTNDSVEFTIQTGTVTDTIEVTLKSWSAPNFPPRITSVQGDAILVEIPEEQLEQLKFTRPMREDYQKKTFGVHIGQCQIKAVDPQGAYRAAVVSKLLREGNTFKVMWGDYEIVRARISKLSYDDILRMLSISAEDRLFIDLRKLSVSGALIGVDLEVLLSTITSAIDSTNIDWEPLRQALAGKQANVMLSETDSIQAILKGLLTYTRQQAKVFNRETELITSFIDDNEPAPEDIIVINEEDAIEVEEILTPNNTAKEAAVVAKEAVPDYAKTYTNPVPAQVAVAGVLKDAYSTDLIAAWDLPITGGGSAASSDGVNWRPLYQLNAGEQYNLIAGQRRYFFTATRNDAVSLFYTANKQELDTIQELYTTPTTRHTFSKQRAMHRIGDRLYLLHISSADGSITEIDDTDIVPAVTELSTYTELAGAVDWVAAGEYTYILLPNALYRWSPDVLTHISLAGTPLPTNPKRIEVVGNVQLLNGKVVDALVVVGDTITISILNDTGTQVLQVIHATNDTGYVRILGARVIYRDSGDLTVYDISTGVTTPLNITLSGNYEGIVGNGVFDAAIATEDPSSVALICSQGFLSLQTSPVSTQETVSKRGAGLPSVVFEGSQFGRNVDLASDLFTGYRNGRRIVSLTTPAIKFYDTDGELVYDAEIGQMPQLGDFVCIYSKGAPKEAGVVWRIIKIESWTFDGDFEITYILEESISS